MRILIAALFLSGCSCSVSSTPTPAPNAGLPQSDFPSWVGKFRDGNVVCYYSVYTGYALSCVVAPKETKKDG